MQVRHLVWHGQHVDDAVDASVERKFGGFEQRVQRAGITAGRSGWGVGGYQRTVREARLFGV